MKMLIRRLIEMTIAAPVIPLTIWAMDTNEPFIYEAIVAQQESVRPGDKLTVTITGVRHRVCPMEIHEEIVDSSRNVHVLEPRVREPTQLGRVESTIEVPIPLAAFPGPAVYKSRLEYRCNPWQQWVWPLSVSRPDIKFEVQGQYGFLTSPLRLADYEPDGGQDISRALEK